MHSRTFGCAISNQRKGVGFYLEFSSLESKSFNHFVTAVFSYSSSMTTFLGKALFIRCTVYVFRERRSIFVSASFLFSFEGGLTFFLSYFDSLHESTDAFSSIWCSKKLLLD